MLSDRPQLSPLCSHLLIAALFGGGLSCNRGRLSLCRIKVHTQYMPHVHANLLQVQRLNGKHEDDDDDDDYEDEEEEEAIAVAGEAYGDGDGDPCPNCGRQYRCCILLWLRHGCRRCWSCYQ